MPDEEPIKRLPTPLPPTEDPAAVEDGGNRDLAVTEEEWFKNTLSGHTVEAAALRNQLARAYIDNMVADREMRKTYASRILRYLECYSAGVAGVLILNGFHPAGFGLEQGVVTTLVGSTAVAAIGLVGFIARGLFRAPPPPPGEKV